MNKNITENQTNFKKKKILIEQKLIEDNAFTYPQIVLEPVPPYRDGHIHPIFNIVKKLEISIPPSFLE